MTFLLPGQGWPLPSSRERLEPGERAGAKESSPRGPECLLSDFQFSKGGRSSFGVPAQGSRICPLHTQRFPLEAAQILPTSPGSMGSGAKSEPNPPEHCRAAQSGKAMHMKHAPLFPWPSSALSVYMLFLHHPHIRGSDVVFSELETSECTAGRQPGRELASPGCPKDQGSLNKAALGTRVLEGGWLPLYHEGLGMRVVSGPHGLCLRTHRFPVLSLLSARKGPEWSQE